MARIEMNADQLRKKIREVIAEMAEFPLGDVKSETHLVEDLGFDSLTVVEAVMKMETNLGLDDNTIDLDSFFNSGVEMTVENVEAFIVKLLLG